MARSRLTHLFTNNIRPVRRPVRKQVGLGRFRPQLEALAARVMPAITATFSAAGAELRVVGDALDNTVVVSRDAAGTILVNGGAVEVQGGQPTVANTRMIMILGGSGDDTLSLDETDGALPAASIFGDDGNDVLTGGSGNDLIVGDSGNDTAFLGAGDDTFVWNTGDGSDTVEGQGGRDTLAFDGSDLAEKFDLSANGDRARLTRDVGGITMDLQGVEDVDLGALGGADTITINDQSTTGLNTVNVDLDGSADAGVGDNQADVVIINGTAGNDVGQIRSVGTRIDATASAIPFVHITGEDGLDALTVNTLGGDDVLDASDLAATNASELIKLTVDGGTGNDTLTGSQGFDTFVRNPGDGNDSIDGGDGEDTLIVNGSDASEQFDLSADASRARFTRDVDGSRTDFGGVEDIDLNPLGGADTITVNDLTGTPVSEIRLDLAGAGGGTAGDGQADAVIVNARNAADSIPILGQLIGVNSGAVLVNGGFANGGGLPYFLAIRATEGALDTLAVNALGGDDRVDASDLAAGVIKVTATGGTGNDTIVGSPGGDTFVWNPGDGSDTIDGRAGLDLLTFNGSDAAEGFVISRDGGHVRLTRDVGNVTMDLDAVDGIELNARGGADTIVVNDLTGTGLINVRVDLSGPGGGGDGQVDSVILDGTDGDDTVRLGTTGDGTVLVDGLVPTVIAGSDGPTDFLTVNAGGGDDTVDALALTGGSIGLIVTGGAGDDFLLGGPGVDTFIWNPGDGSDTIEGQGGPDALEFNGSDAAETFEVSADGHRVRLTRDVGGVTIDMSGVEEIDLNPLGGADTVIVNDQSTTGTDLNHIRLNLAGAARGTVGDGQADSVILNGTDRAESLVIWTFGTPTAIVVEGLSPFVTITGSDGVTDHLTVNTLGGDDRVDASGLPANLIGLTVDLGDGQSTATATTTTLGTSTATAVFGQAEVLTATVSSPAGPPTGFVTFLDRGTVMGTAPVDANGQAVLAVSLGVGDHSLTASFAGSGGFTGSNSAAAAVTVNRAATTVALGSSARPAVTRRAVTFTATAAAVAPGAGTPTGTVTFFVGKKMVARVTLDANGQASIRRIFSRTGPLTVRAVYSGDASFATGTQSITARLRHRHPRR
jgi:hypothetical protein